MPDEESQDCSLLNGYPRTGLRLKHLQESVNTACYLVH